MYACYGFLFSMMNLPMFIVQFWDGFQIASRVKLWTKYLFVF